MTKERAHVCLAGVSTANTENMMRFNVRLSIN